MSATRATGLSLNRRSISKISRWRLGPVRIASFNMQVKFYAYFGGLPIFPNTEKLGPSSASLVSNFWT